MQLLMHKNLYTVITKDILIESFAIVSILINTKILEVNLFVFTYILFHEDFSPSNRSDDIWKSVQRARDNIRWMDAM